MAYDLTGARLSALPTVLASGIPRSEGAGSVTSDWSRPSQSGDEERDEPELSLEELESEAAGSLPDRQAMSLIDASVTITATPALAADVLADTLGDALTEPDPGDESVDGEA